MANTVLFEDGDREKKKTYDVAPSVAMAKLLPKRGEKFMGNEEQKLEYLRKIIECLKPFHFNDGPYRGLIYRLTQAGLATTEKVDAVQGTADVW